MRMKVANMSSYHLDKIPSQWPPVGDFILHGACQEAFMLTCQSNLIITGRDIAPPALQQNLQFEVDKSS